MDSIYRNPRYAHSAVDEALSLTKASDKYYKLLAAKSQIYFANSVYDSGFVLHRSIIDYCDRVPMSPKIHGLLGTLKNTVGNYYSFLDKTDSALLTIDISSMMIKSTSAIIFRFSFGYLKNSKIRP